MAKAKSKFIKQTVARDNKTGRFVSLKTAARRPKTTTVSTVKIPRFTQIAAI